MTKAQEKALELFKQYADSYGPGAYSRPQGVHPNTIYALEKLGLVETQQRPTTVVARLA